MEEENSLSQTLKPRTRFTLINLMRIMKSSDLVITALIVGFLTASASLVRAETMDETTPHTEVADIYIGAPVGTILTGHVYRQILGRSRLFCGSLCTKYATKCHSFNYCDATKLCKLNSVTAAKHHEDLTSAEGCSYYDIAVGK